MKVQALQGLTIANLCENMLTTSVQNKFYIVGKSLWKYSKKKELEQTEVEDVDHYQIVSPVEKVEDKEDGREEVHGNPEQEVQ